MTQKRKIPVDTSVPIAVVPTDTSVPFTTVPTDTSSLDRDPLPDAGPSKSSKSPSAVRERLLSPSFSTKYACTPNLISSVEFRPAKFGDILVVKNGGDTEFIMRGVFDLSRNDFFFTPDGSFDPENVLRTRFQDVKLNARVTAPPSTIYEFAQQDYPIFLDNIRRFEKLIKLDKNEQIISSLCMSAAGIWQLRLSHALFEMRLPSSTLVDDSQEVGHDTDTLSSASAEILGDDFAMESWPVALRCSDLLEELLATHDICPLPAYDLNGDLIPPLLYETLLRGATVQLSFAFVHHHIKKHKRHVFLGNVRQIDILQMATPFPSSPFKRLRVSPTKQDLKGKKRSY